MDREEELRLRFVGSAHSRVRVMDRRFADQARNDFATYVSRTLLFNQKAGGRFNARGEFGALYTATDEATAWVELAARYRREGIPGLPPTMGMIRVLIQRGRYVDLRDEDSRDAWGADLASLTAEAPTEEQQSHCHRLGREIRSVADFLCAPSARSTGGNVPVFVDGREDTELHIELESADDARRTPPEFHQPTQEHWD